MKAQRLHNEGSVLVTTVVITALVGIMLVAYLAMVSSQSRYTMRSVSWNGAMPMAEAGLEEALAHLNYSGTTNLASDGWMKTNDVYTFTRTLGNGYATVTVSTDALPIIISKGYVQAPLQNNYICRTVKAICKKRSPFQGAVTATGTISCSGGTIDSFDSSDANYSTGGLYDVTKRKDNGLLQTSSTAAGAIAVGNARVYGDVATGPGGTVTWGGGAVGDLAFTANAGNIGIESGHQASDVNLSLDPVNIPFTNGFAAPVSGTYSYGGTNYSYRLDSGLYKVAGNFSIPGGKSMVVAGNAEFYVEGSFTLSGSGFIYVAPGASLRLYIYGTTATISGGGIANGTGNAANLSICCLPTCTRMDITGSAQFIGTAYAPQADLTMSGGAAAIGAVVVKTSTFTGGMSFHYDEALAGGSQKYSVTSWLEI